MQFSRVFLNRLPDSLPTADTVVVIDVLRSFTTAAVALARGAAAVYPVADPAAARDLAANLSGAVSVGAIAGGDPAPGFDFGNSPSLLMQQSFVGRPIVLCTAAGVRGLHAFQHVQRLFAASLVCAAATADAILASAAKDVCFVITGEWLDRDGDEDIACADYIEGLLAARASPAAIYAGRVKASDFGRRFGAAAWPKLPAGDLELAVAADLFPRPMVVIRDAQHLVIR